MMRKPVRSPRARARDYVQAADPDSGSPVPARAGAREVPGVGHELCVSGPCARGREHRAVLAVDESLRSGPCARGREEPGVTCFLGVCRCPLRARARGTRCHLFLGCMPLSPAGAGARGGEVPPTHHAAVPSRPV